MQLQTMNGDVVEQVSDFLREQAGVLTAQGVCAERITIDPGIGFGKTVEQNFALLARQSSLLEIGLPILAGWSRKSSLGAVTGRDVAQRQPASVAAALIAVQQGARIVRVHDVQATVDALKVWSAVVEQQLR